MATPLGNKIPTLVIDSSAIRNHLFKGWAVLNRVAIIARAGKINLCISWINELDIPIHDCDSEGNQKSVLELLGKVESSELDALGLSCEADWVTVKAVDSLRDSNCFIVVTTKSINNRSAVVRHLVKITGGTTDLQYLSAVVWIQEVTPETITFAVSQHRGWRDGSWENVIRSDESLKGMPVSHE